MKPRPPPFTLINSRQNKYAKMENNGSAYDTTIQYGTIPNKQMSLGLMMRPIKEGDSQVVTDDYGYVWIQETECGYRRKVDNLFIPDLRLYNHEVHSVEARIIINEGIQTNPQTVVCVTW